MNIKKGFTLVEVLVSVAIIVALVAVIMSAPTSARKQANLTRAKMELEEIATGAFLYYQDMGTWADDPGTGGDADFYNPKYITITGTAEPLTFLGPGYMWDWQNWGTDGVFDGPPYTPNEFMCWQSVDLYRADSSYFYGDGRLVMRKCIRDVCQNQKYCDEQGYCYDTAQFRDTSTGEDGVGDGAGYSGYYQGAGVTAVCEECWNEKDCSRKFLPQ